MTSVSMNDFYEWLQCLLVFTEISTTYDELVQCSYSSRSVGECQMWEPRLPDKKQWCSAELYEIFSTASSWSVCAKCYIMLIS